MEQFINEIEENEQEERAVFVIDNDQKADWAVRRIAELEADTQKWKDYYKAQSERVAQSNQHPRHGRFFYARLRAIVPSWFISPRATRSLRFLRWRMTSFSCSCVG